MTDEPLIDDPPVAWTTLTTGESSRPAEGPVPVRRVVLQVAAATVVVLVLVGALGVVVVRRIAEREAMNDASQLTDLLARTVVMPALEDGLLTDDPGARARFDAEIRARVLTGMFVRVKLWSPDGRILYSDAAALVGEQYPLGEDQRAVLAVPATVAEVSDLSPPENRLERGQGRLVEVYRPVWTPSGSPLLFETYTQYATVTARTADLWRGFSGIVVSSLLLFGVLLMPLLWTLLDRLRRGRDQREVLLQHAIDASEDERRRIAADLHDGVVQELVAASLMVAGAAERAGARGEDPGQVGQLRSAATAVRSCVGTLRTLLVDIYPQNLTSAGLGAALEDLAGGLRGRGVTVEVDVDAAAAEALTAEDQRLVYRMTSECLRNIVKHAAARRARVTLHQDGALLVLEITDDGVGLSGDAAAAAAREGHLGLRLLADLARDHGATLRLASAPGQGTRWRLEVARP
jgi:signal transduction histidine kinase